MKKLLMSLAIVLAFAFGSSVPTLAQQSNLSWVSGVRVSQNYNGWTDRIYTGPVAAASPASFSLTNPYVTLKDGRTIVPFFVGEIVTIGQGATAESVTLTAVSGCYFGAPQGACTISGNTANAHGQGDLVTSGTQGIGEAMNDTSINGGGSVYFEVDCGPVTLSTSSGTTTTSCLVPKTFLNLGASVYVNTTVTTAASYSLGIASATTAWMTSCTSLTAGTNCSQFVSAPAKTAESTGFGDLLITANTTAGAGVIHPKVWGYVMAQSSF